MKKHIEEKWIVDAELDNGDICRYERCEVHSGGNLVIYHLLLPTAVCGWLKSQIRNGLVLGVDLVILLRLKWDEVFNFTLGDLVNCSKNGILIAEPIGFKVVVSRKMVKGGQLLLTLVIERIAYLKTLGYSVEDTYHLPAVSQPKNPKKVATIYELEKYALACPMVFTGTNGEGGQAFQLKKESAI